MHLFIFIDQQVLALIQRHVSVLAFISGHDHDGGYAIDRAGIHHIIPPAPVEVCMYVCMYVCSNIVELYYSFGMQGITVGCFYLYSILSIVQYFKCLYIVMYVCMYRDAVSRGNAN